MTRIKTINVSNNMFVFYSFSSLAWTTWFFTAIEWERGTLEGKLCCNNRRYTVRDRAVLMKEHTFVSAQLYRRLKSIFHRGIYLLFLFLNYFLFAASSLYLLAFSCRRIALYFAVENFQNFRVASSLYLFDIYEFWLWKFHR